MIIIIDMKGSRYERHAMRVGRLFGPRQRQRDEYRYEYDQNPCGVDDHNNCPHQIKHECKSVTS